MGREIERLLVERGHGVGLIVDADNRGDLDAAHLRGIDVALEFTTPATAYDNIRACIDAGTPVVSGTTGWTDRLDELKTRCKERGGAFFYASNYSLGVNLLFRLNRQLAEMVGRVGGYDVRIEEVHHTQKKDAPSGTAITLAEEIIDRIGYPIGASATSNGVTITADAIMGDTYSYAIVYSIRRDDGSPLVSDETLAAGAERDGLLPLRFRNYGTQVRTSGGGAHGSSWFYDADPADNAIQFVEMMTQDQPLKPGTASVKFQDLSVYTDNDYRTSETLAEGTWRLKFDFAFEDSSISLPAGQSFTLNGMDATLDGVTLSPLSIQVDYTVHQELVWSENRESGRENEYDREQSYRYFESLPVVITYTDGTTQDLTNAGGGITPGDGETVCQKSRIFDELRPLDEVASVTVGDIVLPVSAG